jgi:O-antigen/teichoic acid export membrane protein
LKRHRIVLLGSTLRVVSLAATTGVTFFLMPFIIHRLGDHNYGYWALVAAVLGYYGVLDLGIVTAVQFQVAKSMGDGDLESVNRTVSTSFFALAGLGFIICCLTVVVGLSSRLFIANAADVPTFRAVLFIMGADLAIGFPGRAFMGTIQAHLRFDITASISVAVLILRTTLILLVIGAGAGVTSLAVISLMCDSVGYVLTYVALRNIHSGLEVSPRLASWLTLRGLFNYSKFALIIQISDQLRFSLDVWMVSAFVGISAVTHYAIANRLSQAFFALIIAALGILSPWFSQLFGSSNRDGILRVFIIGTKVSAGLSTTIASTLILCGSLFIGRWMGQSYLDAYWPLALLVTAIYCDVAQLPSVSYMFGVSRHRFLAWVTLAEGLANVCLSVYWARKYGMIGVALGTLVPMVVAKLFVQPAYVCKLLGIPLYRYYIKLLGRSVLPPVLGSILFWSLIVRRLHLPNIGAVCLVMLCQAAFAALLTVFVSLNKCERESVFSRIRSRGQGSLAVGAV